MTVMFGVFDHARKPWNRFRLADSDN
jgi:hypothetical protein